MIILMSQPNPFLCLIAGVLVFALYMSFGGGDEDHLSY